jgi:hypothetical protein
MGPEVLEAVKVLMHALKPGETVEFRLVVAGRVLAPGAEPQTATLVVSLPLATTTASCVVESLETRGREAN